MPLMSFSEPGHIPLLISGEKAQTTRQPRKNPVKVGDILYCYYKPRQKDSCRNCITPCRIDFERRQHFGYSYMPAALKPCEKWNKFFGEAVVSVVKPLDFANMTGEEVDDWAVADGFENFEKADAWFTQKYSVRGIDGSDWINWRWEVIVFTPRWIV